MKIKFYIFLIIIFSSYSLFAQNKAIKSYYDDGKKQIKEEYHINDKDSSILDGMYKTYYQNGKTKTVGFYTNNQATDYWEYFYQNGNLKMEGLINNFFNEGHWIFYYENGHKSHDGHMEKGKKNGFWKYYHEDGALKSEGTIKDNKNDGSWRYFHEDGSLKATGNYQLGIGRYTEYYPDGTIKMEGKIKLGKSDSTWNYYHPNGKLKSTGMEINGLKEGEWKFYYENGNASSLGYYTKGETNGFWRYYYEDGTVSSEGIEKEGQKEGQWKMFYSTGKPKGEGHFKDGDGTYTEYFENGKPKIRGQLKKGRYDGKWEYYYEDGIKEGECTYFNGEGWYTGYYPEGSKKMEGFLKDGVKISVWKLYKKDGSIAGYYRNFEEEDELPVAKPKARDSLVLVKTPEIIKKKDKRFKIRLYKPNPNIYKSFIVSFEPINIALGNLPLNLEYYVQERHGFEFSFIYFRKPFFSSLSSQPLRSVVSEGYGYGLKYKKYFFDPEFIGLPYISGEMRGKNISYSANDVDSLTLMLEVISMSESMYELNLLIGDRLMKNYDQRSFTIDIYFGIGLGYKSLTKNYNSDAYDAIFNQINKNSFYYPFRFGISFGYAF